MTKVECVYFQGNSYGELESCVACGKPASGSHSLPVFNGDVVSNDWPLEWGAKPCCKACHDAHAAGRMPCADADYVHLLNSARHLHIDGSGI